MQMSLPARPTIVVFGGSGFVGRALCASLVQRFGGGGARIRVPTRRLPHAASVQSLPTVEVLQADVHDDAALAALLQGADAVVNLIAILHGNDAAFERVHVALPRRIAQACQAAGVRRLVHVSALGVSPDAPSRYLRSKAAGERVLQEAKLDLTLLRPSVIFGAQDKLTNLFAQMQAVLPLLPLASADAQFQPVWVEDVAQAIVQALVLPASIGQTYECAGPQAMSLRELVQAAGRHAGKARPVLGLPAALASMQALLFELLPGEPLMSRDNLASMRVPNVASGKLPGLSALGVSASQLHAVAPGYLALSQGPGRFEAWRSRHR
jgi:uncharacterized protein YbjT (DUF2867 family)